VSDFPADTAHLGSFDPLEAPLVIELLAEHGIVAFSKAPLDQAEGQPYGPIFGDSGRGRLMVDAARLAEARRIVEEELPTRIADMEAALDEAWDSGELTEAGTESSGPEGDV
jgi:hypothetical protein